MSVGGAVRALGIDAVEIARIADVVRRRGDRFLERVYTDGERRLAATRRDRDAHLAGRFAAKEAVLKVLGTGWGTGVAFREVEVVREPSGAPRVVLHGAAADRARELGLVGVLLSISHTRSDAYAVATGIGPVGY